MMSVAEQAATLDAIRKSIFSSAQPRAPCCKTTCRPDGRSLRQASCLADKQALSAVALALLRLAPQVVAAEAVQA